MPLIILFGIAARFLTKYIVTKAMLVLGLGFVSYTGVDLLVDNIEAQLLSQYSGLPANVWAMASLCGLDVAITIVVSAMALSLQIRLISAGAKMLTRLGR